MVGSCAVSLAAESFHGEVSGGSFLEYLCLYYSIDLAGFDHMWLNYYVIDQYVHVF